MKSTWMIVEFAIVVACSVWAGGCSRGGLPPAHVYNLAGVKTEGRKYCAKVEKSARAASLARSQEAWTAAAFAVAFGVGSTVMTTIGAPNEKDHPASNKAFRGVNVGLTAGAAALGTFTTYMFDRASAASSAAAVASDAASETNDQAAAEKCNKALAQWNSDRATALTNAKSEYTTRKQAPPDNAPAANDPAANAPAANDPAANAPAGNPSTRSLPTRRRPR